MVAGNLVGSVGVAAAQTAPVGAGFNLNESDLRFILQQIDIAERHAATATPDNPCGTLLGPGPDQIPNQTNQGVELPLGLRTVDGSCNNLIPRQERYGAAGEVFPRATAPVWRPAESGDPDGPGPAARVPTSYKQKKGIVFDSRPRVISNLIVDQSVNNPAAAAAAGEGATPDDSGTYFIPNEAPDVGLSAPFNMWFTLFGQFFDHGLDLVNKGASGAIFMPLQPDDPLYNPDSHTNFMVLTRATNRPGPDGIVGDDPSTAEDESADDIHQHVNTTSPFVDQNQTYASHPSHQVFLREYELNPEGRPVSTGRLIDGATGGMATWGEVKAQARNVLGIELDDQDALNVPLLATDQYGRFIRDPETGFAQIVSRAGLESGTPAAPVDATRALRAGNDVVGHIGDGTEFLVDINHFAVPFGDLDGDPATRAKGPLTPDADDVPGGAPPPAGHYDDELLDAHFITGDGRVNENIGLTSVHTIFHAEHNRLTGHIEDVLEATGDADFIAQWHAEDGPSGWDYGERLFQAGKFVTEMEYQHLVFEEFARKVQPMVNVFGEGGVGYHTRINPAIVAEFAHTVYRFGHSMLTETVARTNPDGSRDNIALLDAFLNPIAFDDGGTLPAAAAAGRVVQGTTRQVGNEIDEFVTEALRNNLLGLPLDLASINLARGRDTGIPPLNSARRQFYAESEDSQVKPYESWADFGFNLKHAESLVNFVAAYGTHPRVQNATTLAAKRAAAELLVKADPTNPETPADAVDFLNSTGNWANKANGVTITGVDDIDFWVGGLAEKRMVFGGLLGPSFNYIFEKQMENLQDADRFYYLARTAGLNLLTQLEGNSFAELTMRTTTAKALPADAFSRPAYVFDVAALGTSGPIQDDPATPIEEQDESELLIRMPNGTIRYTGPEHVVFNGTSGGDRVWSSEGDDTIRGNDGNDWMEGGDGVDNLIGGNGDDIMHDLFGDDTIKGGDGDDAISSGRGFGGDLDQGGRGKDFILGGNDITETFAGPDDDFVFAGGSEDTVFGDDGNDWIEGGEGPFNLLQGDNGAPFQDDPNGGHDVLDGDGGEQDFDAEGGDDAMLMGPGIQRAEGMLGFDWATHKGDPEVADSDMNFTGLLPPSLDNNRDRFDLVEALSGWHKSDVLRGDDRTADEIVGPGDAAIGDGHALDAAGIARITGLQALLGTDVTSFDAGNIILGGAGSDIIEGRGGDDIIDGDRWLNVALRAPNPDTADPADSHLVDSMRELRADVFAGKIDPGDISIVRRIQTEAAGDDIDTAMFSDSRANYTITPNANTDVMTVDHVGGTGADGTDTVRNVERLSFTDQTIDTSDGSVVQAPGTVAIVDAGTGNLVTTPSEDQELRASLTLDDGVDADLDTVRFDWQDESGGNGWTTIAQGETFIPGNAEVESTLRVVAIFRDRDGVTYQVTSVPAQPVVNVNDPPTGTVGLQRLVNGFARAGRALTATTGTIADGDGLGGLHPRWEMTRADGSWTTVSTGATFTPTRRQAGRKLRVIVSYTDDNGATETLMSSEVSVVDVPDAPRLRRARRGRRGRPRTAIARWRRPESTGGVSITGYRVIALEMKSRRPRARVLDRRRSPLLASGRRSFSFRLSRGNYRFRVVAKNEVGRGPWSSRSNLVRPR